MMNHPNNTRSPHLSHFTRNWKNLLQQRKNFFFFFRIIANNNVPYFWNFPSYHNELRAELQHGFDIKASSITGLEKKKKKKQQLKDDLIGMRKKSNVIAGKPYVK